MMAKTAAQAPTPHPPTAPGAATRTLYGLARTCLLGAALVLAACGGGGGGDEAPPAGTPTFRVGGQLAGLGVGKTVVIADASGPSAAVSANGSYSLQLPAGTAYSLRIAAQPVGQTCTLTNAAGTVSAEVNNISVACLDNAVPSNARTLGGSVAGLGAGKSLVLQLSAGGATQEASVAADGRALPHHRAQPAAEPDLHGLRWRRRGRFQWPGPVHQRGLRRHGLPAVGHRARQHRRSGAAQHRQWRHGHRGRQWRVQLCPAGAGGHGLFRHGV
ncbi:MAG: hypothetical protein O9337_21390 [Acidovorax sp.]|uniref:hypothetical protein n=1 Tax=Acidovorax sp. TaxID=1872122 RepID=UPI0022C70FAA|nr:hypothetical protein [Acidovorax sp.]MCZ8221983.1 hypothetical protein [Acidovorax sp.]